MNSPTSSSTGPPRLRRALPRMLCAAVLLAAAGLLVAVAGVNSDRGRLWIQDRINREIHGTLTMKRLRIRLLPLGLELDDGRIDDPDGRSVAGFRRLTATLDLLALIHGAVSLPAIDVQSPWLDDRYGADGRLGLERAVALSTSGATTAAPSTTAGAGPWPLAIGALTLIDGRLSLSDTASGRHLVAAALQATVRLDGLARQAAITLLIPRSAFTDSSGRIRLPPVEARARLEPDRIDTLSVRAIDDRLQLNLSGAIHDLNVRPRLDLHLAVTLEPALARELNLPVAFDGPLEAEMRVHGTVDAPQATVDLSWAGGKVSGLSLGSGQARLTLKDRRVGLTDTRLDLPAGRLDLAGEADLTGVFPDGLWAERVDAEKIVFRLSAASRALAMERLPYAPAGLKGRLTGTVALNGHGWQTRRQLDLQADLQAVGMAGLAPDAGPLSLGAQARLTGSRIQIDAVRVAMGQMRVDGAGRIDLDQGRIKASARAQGLDLAGVGPFFGSDDLSGHADLTLSASGLWDRPRIEADLKAADLKAGGRTLGDLALNAVLQPDGTVTVDRLALNQAEASVTASGRIDLFGPHFTLRPTPEMAIEAAAHDLPLATVFGNDQIQGRLNARFQAAGRLPAVEGRGALTAEKVIFGPMGSDTITAALVFQDGQVRLTQATAIRGRSAVHLDGTIRLADAGRPAWLPNPEVDLNFRSDDLALEDLFPDRAGRVTLSGQIHGPIDRLAGQATVHGQNLDLGVQRFDQIEARLHLSDETLYLDDLSATLAPGAAVHAQGWVSRQAHFAVHLTAADIDLVHLDRLHADQTLNGRLDLNIDASGTLDEPTAEAEARLTGVRLNGQPMDDFRLHAHLDQGRIQIAGQLNFAMTASYDLSGGAFQFDATLDDTELAPYFRMLNQPDLAGRASGRIMSRGRVADWTQITGRIDISQAAVTWQGRQLVQSGPWAVALQDRVLTITDIDLGLAGDGRLRIRGRADLAGEVDLQAEGHLPLTALHHLIPDMPLQAGQIDLGVHVSGPLASPRWSGHLTLADGRARLPSIDQPIEEIHVRLVLAEQELSVDHATARLGNGRLSLAGRADLAAWPQPTLALRLTADAVTVDWPQNLAAAVSGQLTLDGPPSAAVLAGELTLVSGRYTRPVRMSLIPDLAGQRRPPTPPAADTHRLLAGIALNVTVRSRTPLQVDNNLARLELVPDLRLAGTLAQPVITGRATVSSGTVTYRKRRFAITRGVIDFVDPYRTAPVVNLQGETSVRRWTIILSVNGPPQELAFELSSNPREEEADILSLLLLGRTQQELIRSAGGSTETTEQILAELVADSVGEDLKRTTGLDIVEVGRTSGTDSDGIAVTLGKQLSRRLAIKYRAESRDGQMVQRATAEYQLLESLLLSTYQDSIGALGGTLQFRLEFR